MNTLPALSDIEITEYDKIWLNEAWRIITETGKKPDYLILRKNLKDQLPTTYKPLAIDPKLVESNTNCTIPSLLGVLLANPSTDILEIGNKVVEFVRETLNQNPDNNHFNIQELANEIGVTKEKVQAVVQILLGRFSFWNTAKNLAADDYGFESFSVSAPHAYESVISFISFDEIIRDWFKSIQNATKKKEPISNIYFTSSFGHSGGVGGKLFKSTSSTKAFVHHQRFDQLLAIKNDQFDLSKLIKLCDELNVCHNYNCYYSVALLIRSVINHVPPIFGLGKFEDVVSKYRSDGNALSFQQSMTHLEDSSRKIADSFAHSLVRKKEELPTETQVDFRRDLDVLLGEIVRILK